MNVGIAAFVSISDDTNVSSAIETKMLWLVKPGPCGVDVEQTTSYILVKRPWLFHIPVLSSRLTYLKPYFNLYDFDWRDGNEILAG